MSSCCDFLEEVVTRMVVGLLCCSRDASLGRFMRLDLRGMRERVVRFVPTFSFGFASTAFLRVPWTLAIFFFFLFE